MKMNDEKNLEQNAPSPAGAAEQLSGARSEEERKRDAKVSRNLLIAGFCVLLLTVAAMIYSGIVLKAGANTTRVIIVAGLAVFWLLTDVVSPIAAHETAGKTKEQVTKVWPGSLCDLAGYAGIGFYFFASSSNTGIYGILVYALSIMLKRRLLNEQKPQENTAAEDNEEEAPASLGTAADRALRMAKAGGAAQAEAEQQYQESRKQRIRNMASMNTADLEEETVTDPEQPAAGETSVEETSVEETDGSV